MANLYRVSLSIAGLRGHRSALCVFNFDHVEIATGKKAGLELLNELEVFAVCRSSDAISKNKVDAKWEISMRAGARTYRLVGR